MANKFWVGGGSSTSWNASPTTNWANTTGGAGNQTAPTTGDSVFFDGNSGTGNSVWNTAISLASLDCTLSKNVITHNSAIGITISSGNLVLPTGVGGTYTANANTSLFTITGTSGTQQITTNGFLPGSLTINAVGGTAQLQDNLSLIVNSASTVTLTAGTFDSQSFTVTAAKFVGSGATTRVLTGSGLWSLGGSTATATIWSSATTGMTVAAFTANITIAAAATISDRTFAGGGVTLAGTLTVGANSSGGALVITGANTLGNLSISGPNLVVLSLATTTTLSNAPTFSGSSSGQITFMSNTTSSSATLSVASGTAAFSWCGLRDITGTGGATFTATDSFDLGHNSGITIAAPGGAGSSITSKSVIGS